MSDRHSNRTVTRRAVLSSLAAGSALGALSSGVAAAERRASVDGTATGAVESRDGLEYVVKVLCGSSDGEVVAPGEYWTAINVHNPLDEPFQFVWKVATAGPREPGPVSDFDGIQLGPDEAFELDCPHLVELAEGDGELLEGFLVLRSGIELDVVAVYTAAGEDGTVRTMDVVEVQPSARATTGDRLPDLVPSVPRCDPLTVEVTNRGTAPAGASRTVVDYGQLGSDDAATPPLDPGESRFHRFVPPVGCHDPDCDFTVTVDADDAVDESNEENNVLRDSCLG